MVPLLRIPHLLALAFACVSIAQAQPRAKHVLVVSIDGGNPDEMAKAEMPTWQRLLAEGASSLKARTILPSKTLPSHTSMLTGVDIARHGVDWNDFLPLRGAVKVTTAFEHLKALQPASSSALFCGKIKFRHLWKSGSMQVFDCGGVYGDVPVPASEEKKLVEATVVAQRAAQHLTQAKPTLCFVHLPDADTAGHRHGWGSPEQMQAFARCDQALAQLLEALKAAGMLEQSVLIVSADHGGKNKNHFDPIAEDIHIPWLAWGQGVRRGAKLNDGIMTYDTCATALWLLDALPADADLDGVPVRAAFER